MVRTFVAIGSNLGDREAHLRSAVEAMAALGRIGKVSDLYETAPMYVVDQPPFLNGVVELWTELGPWPLVQALKGIEREVGRREGQRFGPREVDLDLVAYGALAYVFRDPSGVVLVQVPHPRTPERRFVLEPLFEIDPELVLPSLGPVKSLRAATEAQAESVRRIGHAVFSLPS